MKWWERRRRAQKVDHLFDTVRDICEHYDKVSHDFRLLNPRPLVFTPQRAQWELDKLAYLEAHPYV